LINHNLSVHNNSLFILTQKDVLSFQSIIERK
jgi:hypothetical protein